MKRSLIGSVVFLACLSSIAMAQKPAIDLAPFQGENLNIALPSGWVTVTSEKQGSMVFSEFVPKGQTADDWKEMITVQVIHGAGNVNPKDFLDRMNAEVQGAVEPGTFAMKTLDMSKTSRYPSAGVLWLSGKVKSTGRGEVTAIRAIQGKDSLYIVQKAWRQAPFASAEKLTVTADEMQKGIEFLKQAKVVDTRK
jgi:hypothetical protein